MLADEQAKATNENANITGRNHPMMTIIKKFAKELVIAFVLAIIAAIAIEIYLQHHRTMVMESNAKAIAKLYVYDSKRELIATASGIFISSDGKLVTNCHVIEDAADISAKLSTGAYYALKSLIGINKSHDLAVLQFDAKEVPYVKIKYNVEVNTGESVFAIGSPMGLENSISEGIVSNPDRKEGNVELIQFTAPISSGSSGGGLFNHHGNIVGITTSMMVGRQTNENAENINFAVPVKYIEKAITGEDINFTENSPDYYYSQGVIYSNKKEYEKAIVCLKKAIQIDDKYAGAYTQLGEIYYDTGQYQQEVTVLENAKQLLPNDPDVFLSLAMADEDIGKYQDAIDDYKSTLTYRNNDKDALYALCFLEIMVGNRNEATNDIEELAKVNFGLADEMKMLLKRTN
jgi:tetratricopeptide (TPR) repeat protein